MTLRSASSYREEVVNAYIGGLPPAQADYARAYWAHLVSDGQQPSFESFDGLSYSDAQQIRIRLSQQIG